MEEVDQRLVFALEDLYPEPEAAFSTWLRSVEDIVPECLVVLDTSVLLTPYTINPKSIDQIATAYRRLIGAGRLRIPGRVAREFAKNRSTKLEELFQQLSRKRAGLPKLGGGRYPLLEPVEQYQAALSLEAELEEKQAEYRKALQGVIDHVKGWTWNDPVSSVYGDLFTDAVLCDPDFDEEDVLAKLQDRYRLRVPPGYKDSGKADGGVGDLLIWLTILRIANDEKKDVLFVSGDEKSDWWHQSEGQALYPRFELAEEFRRHSEGQSFQVTKLSGFLDLFGVEPGVVEEVRKEEAESRARQTAYVRSMHEEFRAVEDAVAAWADVRFSAQKSERGRRDAPDILVEDSDGEIIGVEILSIRGPASPMLFHRVRELAIRGHWWRSKHRLTVYALAIVAPDPDVAKQVANLLSRRNWELPETHCHVGYLDDGRFTESSEVRV